MKVKQNGNQSSAKMLSPQAPMRTSQRRDRERSESPNYNEPPKLEIMSSVDDEEEPSFEYSSTLLMNEEHLRPGRTIISCPRVGCESRSSKVIEIVAHFRETHVMESNSLQPSINVFMCPLCSSARFNSATTSSIIAILQEHAVRYHGRTLAQNEFPLLCSITINSEHVTDNCPRMPQVKINQSDLKKPTKAELSANSSKSERYEEQDDTADSHSAAMTLASLQQILEKNREEVDVKPHKQTRKKTNSLEALSKVAHFNNYLNSPKPSTKADTSQDPKLNNISGLHTLALLSIQNHEASEPSVQQQQRQILPKVTQFKVPEGETPTKTKLAKNAKETAAPLTPAVVTTSSQQPTQPAASGVVRKRMLPPLAIKPNTSSPQNGRGSVSTPITTASPPTKLAKLAIPPLPSSSTASQHPKLILPANGTHNNSNNPGAISSSTITSVSLSTAVNMAAAKGVRQKGLGQKILISPNTSQIHPNTQPVSVLSTVENNLPSKSSNGLTNDVNSIVRSQSLQDSIATNKNLTALMLQIQNSQNSPIANNSTSAPLAIISTAQKNPGMTIVSRTADDGTAQNSSSNLIKNSPIRFMISSEPSTIGGKSLIDAKRVSPTSLVKHLTVVNNVVTSQPFPGSIGSNGTQPNAPNSTVSSSQPAQRNHKPNAQLLKQPLLKILPKPAKNPPSQGNILKQAYQNKEGESILVKVDSNPKGPRANSLRSNHKNNLKNITAM